MGRQAVDEAQNRGASAIELRDLQTRQISLAFPSHPPSRHTTLINTSHHTSRTSAHHGLQLKDSR